MAILSAVTAIHGACVPSQSCDDACVGNARRICEDYSTDRGHLEECGPARTCVEGVRSYGYYAACALRGRDPRCDPEVDQGFCDGRKIVGCHGAFPTKEIDCAARGLFCATDGRSAGCVPSDKPEPRCTADGGPRSSFCDGDVPVECFGRFAEPLGAPCAPRQGHCIVTEAGAGCEHPF